MACDVSKLFTGEGLAIRGMSLKTRISSKDPNVRKYGYQDFAKELSKPIRESILSNDIISEIFPSIKIGV